MGKRIVVVDDDAPMLEFFTILLSEVEDYEVITCPSGKVAMDCVRTALPQVIILDAHLETVNTGWDVLDQLKADPLLAPIPVIVCTADPNDLQQHTALLQSSGSMGLPKPFEVDDLLGMLQKALES
jgi:CheY-like chemotaxis protein